ncbi:MAG: hypothetical protein HYX97_06860, partial [Chloroflexi bacterium]|nr:hypothetical protein [Chloroflexota bacterium]
GLMACFHPSPGEHDPDFTSHGHFMGKVAKYAGLAHPLAPIVAPLMDNAVLMTSFFYYGHLERFPKLKLGFFHSGASWLYIVLEKSEGYLALPFFPRDYPVREDPDHLFYERKCLITFDADDTPLFRMPDSFADVAVFSTRYPNQDTTTPQEILAGLKSAGISSDVTRKLMGGNLLSVAGLQAAARKSK